jgi:hypothetical protein
MVWAETAKHRAADAAASRRSARPGARTCLLVATLLSACTSADKRTVNETKVRAKPPPAENTENTADRGWTRAEWLRAVSGYVADPATMPRLATSRAAFEQIVTTRAWLELDGPTFEREGLELLGFFPAIKRLTAALLSNGGTVDEVAAVGLYALDVYGAMVRAGVDFVDGLPAADPTRETRLSGLDELRLGAAIHLCGLFSVLLGASERYRTPAFDKFVQPASYAIYSREALQLILATLDEKIAPRVPAALRPTYERIRAVVASQHDAREATPSASRVTYEGLESAGLTPRPPFQPVVSTTGGFSVEIGPVALIKRVDTRRPDGRVVSQHWIEAKHGEVDFQAMCLDDRSEADLIESFARVPGSVAERPQLPGTWFRIEAPQREGRIRITTVGQRGCLASVEGPRGQVPTALVEPFLLSLRPAPSAP